MALNSREESTHLLIEEMGTSPPNAKRIEQLLAAGADVNSCMPNGTKLIFYAAHSTNPSIIKILLKFGASLGDRDNFDKVTPLHDAVELWGGRPVNAEFLIKNGADIHARDKMGRTPLHAAAGAALPDCVNLLLKKGCDLYATDKEGNMPIDKAIEQLSGHWANSDIDGTGAILVQAMNFSNVEDGGISLLSTAVFFGHPQTVAALLDKGVSPTAPGEDGKSAFDTLEDILEDDNKDEIYDLLDKHG